MADPMVSEGARLERKAVRNRLRRMAKEYDRKGDLIAKEAIDTEIQWMLDRHMRYERLAGGLGVVIPDWRESFFKKDAGQAGIK